MALFQTAESETLVCSGVPQIPFSLPVLLYNVVMSKLLDWPRAEIHLTMG